MSISFDPHTHSSISVPTQIESGEIYNGAIEGISSGLSSISSYLPHDESSGGLCSWMGQAIEQILELIRNLFIAKPIVFPIHDRLNKGREIINAHFANEQFSTFNSRRAVAVVIIKYNDEVVYKFSKLRGDGKETLVRSSLRELETLLQNENNSECHNGILEIKTLIIEKSEDNSIKFYKLGSQVNFADEQPNVQNDAWESARLQRGQLFLRLPREIPSPSQRQRVLDLVENHRT